MAKLFKELVESILSTSEIKSKIEAYDSHDIKILIDDIFWRYDEKKASLKTHVENNKEMEQRLIDVVSEYPYYKEVLLEELNVFQRLRMDYIKDLSLVKNLNIDDKETFLIILEKLNCFYFFKLNYKKFDYNEEEKEKIKKLFENTKVPQTSNKEKEKIYNKTGLIEPFFLNVNINLGSHQRAFEFFVENFEKSKDFFIVLNMFTKEEFNLDLYEYFLKRNIGLMKNFPSYIEKNIKIISKNKRMEEKDIKYLNYLQKLTERLIAKEELKNF